MMRKRRSEDERMIHAVAAVRPFHTTAAVAAAALAATAAAAAAAMAEAAAAHDHHRDNHRHQQGGGRGAGPGPGGVAGPPPRWDAPRGERVWDDSGPSPFGSSEHTFPMEWVSFNPRQVHCHRSPRRR